MAQALNIKKPYEEYGGGPLALVWQDGVLYDKSGKILPKDYQELVKRGYKVPIPLRKKIRTYAKEQQRMAELRAFRARQDAEFAREEEQIRRELDELARMEVMQEQLQNPSFQNTMPPEQAPPPMPLFPMEQQAQQILQTLEPNGLPQPQYAPAQELMSQAPQVPPFQFPQQQYQQAGNYYSDEQVAADSPMYNQRMGG